MGESIGQTYIVYEYWILTECLCQNFRVSYQFENCVSVYSYNNDENIFPVFSTNIPSFL